MILVAMRRVYFEKALLGVPSPWPLLLFGKWEKLGESQDGAGKEERVEKSFRKQ